MATRPDLPAHELTVALELAQHGAGVDAITRAQLLGRERPVRARVASDQLGQRVGHVGEERLGQPAGRDGTERVTVEAGLVGGDAALLAADAHSG